LVKGVVAEFKLQLARRRTSAIEQAEGHNAGKTGRAKIEGLRTAATRRERNNPQQVWRVRNLPQGLIECCHQTPEAR